MGDIKEFVITEAAFRAVIETMTDMNYAMQIAQAESQAATEAVCILNHRLDAVEAAFTGQPA